MKTYVVGTYKKCLAQASYACSALIVLYFRMYRSGMFVHLLLVLALSLPGLGPVDVSTGKETILAEARIHLSG